MRKSIVLLVAFGWACGSEETTISARDNVSLSLAVPEPANPSGGGSAADSMTISLGGDTLEIDRAVVVLAEIEFDRAEELACPGGDDDCGEFDAGPVVFELPLDGSVAHALSATVPEGTYDEIEFEIDELGDEARDDALLNLHPELADTSVRVEGRFNGAAFVFISDLDEEQELEFNTPIHISGATNITLRLDLATWFVGAGGLLDPRAAATDGSVKSQIENNIKDSIEGIEDDDEDGEDDEDE